eukprot:TRINITY_DN2705_c0_g1_i12.p2 TRINITY_DN2705_c0_g1~~TRINITY_DN2705_c0_g1_i12.p2  ORF type:complete len:147 (+),score=17.87 TRINITY_DN2705_c0_g1_i12:63-503(+)
MSVLNQVAGILVLKMMLMHYLTVRARLMSGRHKWSEDTRTAQSIIGDTMKVLTLCWGPKIDVDRLVGVVHNSVENEPFFLVAASMLGGGHDDLMWAYCIARCLHAFFFLVQLQPFRGIAYSVALGINIYFGWMLAKLQKSSSSSWF